MNIAWFRKYQPKTLDEYVFENDEQKQLIKNWLNNNFIDGNILLAGRAGTGKTAIAEILIRSLIKSQSDIIKIKKSIEEVKDLETWLQKRPVKSAIKIVYLEEFDKLSRAASDFLKDGLMEKYLEYTSFIATTNYINRVDYAVLTRFTHKLLFTNNNKSGTLKRLSEILTQENISFDLEQLGLFVEKNISIGMRDLINNLQIHCKNGKIELSSVNLQRSDSESIVIDQTINILTFLQTCSDAHARRLCYINPLHSEIAVQYSTILETIQYNQNIDYTDIFMQLDEKIHFLPIKTLIYRYEKQLDMQRIPHIHYLSFLGEAIKSILDIIL